MIDGRGGARFAGNCEERRHVGDPLGLEVVRLGQKKKSKINTRHRFYPGMSPYFIHGCADGSQPDHPKGCRPWFLRLSQIERQDFDTEILGADLTPHGSTGKWEGRPLDRSMLSLFPDGAAIKAASLW